MAGLKIEGPVYRKETENVSMLLIQICVKLMIFFSRLEGGDNRLYYLWSVQDLLIMYREFAILSVGPKRDPDLPRNLTTQLIDKFAALVLQ